MRTGANGCCTVADGCARCALVRKGANSRRPAGTSTLGAGVPRECLCNPPTSLRPVGLPREPRGFGPYKRARLVVGGLGRTHQGQHRQRPALARWWGLYPCERASAIDPSLQGRRHVNGAAIFHGPTHRGEVNRCRFRRLHVTLGVLQAVSVDCHPMCREVGRIAELTTAQGAEQGLTSIKASDIEGAAQGTGIGGRVGGHGIGGEAGIRAR